MTVLKKLNEARKRFHATAIKKTGRNTFSNYDYFELGDFLVPALLIFESLELSAVISFGVDLASMTLTDLEDGSQFVITSPMSTASLKACHEVQNLGAVQTYLRRYLWVAALEIVEHDALDSVTGSEHGKPEVKQKPADQPYQGNKREKPMRTKVMQIRTALQEAIAADKELGVLEEYDGAWESGDEELVNGIWAGLTTPERQYITRLLNEREKRGQKEAA
jgi:hypothetical protein